MNNLAEVFARGKAFIPFITAGDPSLAMTEQLILSMEKAGADLIAIGLPFSDPIAEGTVIQKANARSLANGTTTNKIFTMLERLRNKTAVPLALKSYINPIFTYGTELFMQHCSQCQITAVIVPDLPFEEKKEIAAAAKKYGVTVISFITSASRERSSTITKEAEGFIYCVSSPGIKKEVTADLKEMIGLVKKSKDLPCVVGFDCLTPEQANKISKFADGIIVDSSIIKIIEEQGSDCLPPVTEYVRKIKTTCNSQ